MEDVAVVAVGHRGAHLVEKEEGVLGWHALRILADLCPQVTARRQLHHNVDKVLPGVVGEMAGFNATEISGRRNRARSAQQPTNQPINHTDPRINPTFPLKSADDDGFSPRWQTRWCTG